MNTSAVHPLLSPSGLTLPKKIYDWDKKRYRKWRVRRDCISGPQTCSPAFIKPMASGKCLSNIVLYFLGRPYGFHFDSNNKIDPARSGKRFFGANWNFQFGSLWIYQICPLFVFLFEFQDAASALPSDLHQRVCRNKDLGRSKNDKMLITANVSDLFIWILYEQKKSSNTQSRWKVVPSFALAECMT